MTHTFRPLGVGRGEQELPPRCERTGQVGGGRGRGRGGGGGGGGSSLALL